MASAQIVFPVENPMKAYSRLAFPHLLVLVRSLYANRIYAIAKISPVLVCAYFPRYSIFRSQPAVHYYVTLLTGIALRLYPLHLALKTNNEKYSSIGKSFALREKDLG